MTDPLIGRTLAHYRIEQRLGAGGMGVVYAARDLRLDRRVALKILTATDEAARDRLLHEARAASALSHPHVCGIYAVEEAEDLAFIVMEYVGSTRDCRVSRQRPRPTLPACRRDPGGTRDGGATWRCGRRTSASGTSTRTRGKTS